MERAQIYINHDTECWQLSKVLCLPYLSRLWNPQRQAYSHTGRFFSLDSTNQSWVARQVELWEQNRMTIVHWSQNKPSAVHEQNRAHLCVPCHKTILDQGLMTRSGRTSWVQLSIDFSLIWDSHHTQKHRNTRRENIQINLHLRLSF